MSDMLNVQLGSTSAGASAPGPSVPDAPDAPAWPELVLPAGAEEQPDGSVLLTLDYPVTIQFRGQNDASETIRSLSLHRLTGADVHRFFAVNERRLAGVSLAAATGMAPSRVAMIVKLMDASDLNAANAVVSALLDMGDGLPERAEVTDTGVVLPLLVPTADRAELTFRRLTGGDLEAAASTKDSIALIVSRVFAMTPKEAREMLDEMDGADAVGVVRVVGFLSGNGRVTGR